MSVLTIVLWLCLLSIYDWDVSAQFKFSETIKNMSNTWVEFYLINLMSNIVQLYSILIDGEKKILAKFNVSIFSQFQNCSIVSCSLLCFCLSFFSTPFILIHSPHHFTSPNVVIVKKTQFRVCENSILFHSIESQSSIKFDTLTPVAFGGWRESREKLEYNTFFDTKTAKTSRVVQCRNQ